LAHRFTNLDPSHRPHGAKAILRWGVTDRLLGRRKRRPPGPPAPIVTPDFDLINSPGNTPWLTWLGHASFLGCLGGRRFLIDPVFSSHAAWIYRRYLPPPMTIDELPEIHVVMVTHNHYDHLDAGAYRLLPQSVRVIVPEGLGAWMRRLGRERVTELGWWQEFETDGLRITLVPANHWSKRGVFDTNRILWGGYVVEGGNRSVYHSGDTGLFAGFAEIAQRFTSLDAAILPIGAYEPAWFMEHYHLNPEQAGEVFMNLGAHRFVPMHWGSFQLTDEPLCEPADRILSWWDRQHVGDNRRLEILDVGSTVTLDGR
jgi:L-ascorbate metabolism protein UlaG (beta-lactamase superfamily)